MELFKVAERRDLKFVVAKISRQYCGQGVY